MNSSRPFESVAFDVSEAGVTVRLSLSALKALVSAVEDKAKAAEIFSQSPAQRDPVQSLKPDSLLMSLNDSAKALGVSKPTIYNLLRYNAIKAVKLGSRTMIPTQALRDYAASLKTREPEAPGKEPKRLAPLPDATTGGHRKLKFRAVMALTGLSRQQLFVRRNAGTFPPGVTLSSGVLGWDQADVDAWIADPAGYRAEPES